MDIEIYIRPHFSEWLKANFTVDNSVVLPSQLNKLLLSLLVTRKKREPNIHPNITIKTNERIDTKRLTKFYCALSKKNRYAFERGVSELFWTDAETYINTSRTVGKTIREAAFDFIVENDITSITEEAIIKHHQRKQNKMLNKVKYLPKYNMKNHNIETE